VEDSRRAGKPNLESVVHGVACYFGEYAESFAAGVPREYDTFFGCKAIL
jgi:hypothetical protein